MAEVLSAPVRLNGYYSPRCRSPQPSFGASTGGYERSIARSRVDKYDAFQPQKGSPLLSSVSSSPDLSSLLESAQSSLPTSVASSFCLDSSATVTNEEPYLLPVYDYSASSPELDYTETEAELFVEHAEVVEKPPTSSPISSATTLPDSSSESLFADVQAPVSYTDDNFMRHEPSRHVDYLSHDWKEEDIWASWRYIVGKRKAYSNAARLENASWRTWSKSKYQLKTIRPETLNWLKDCDVTWLYGPLSTGQRPLSTSSSPNSPSASPAENRSQPSSAYKTRPILKKRSMSEIMLQRSLSTSSLLKQAAAAIESQQSESRRPARPQIQNRMNSDFGSYSSSKKTTSTLNTGDAPSHISTGCQSPLSTKHIHFDDRVLQCIAVETEDEGVSFSKDDSDDSSDDEGILMMASPRTSRRNSDQSVGEPQTIAMLPSTTLKSMEEPKIKKTESFMSFNSFFCTTGSKVVTEPHSPLPSPATEKKRYVLEDDDDDLAGLDWKPNGAAFGVSKESTASDILPRFDNSGSIQDAEADEFQLPRYAYGDEEEDPNAGGIIGRAVDAVNTARDIAHVLWNVGWRR